MAGQAAHTLGGVAGMKGCFPETGSGPICTSITGTALRKRSLLTAAQNHATRFPGTGLGNLGLDQQIRPVEASALHWPGA